MSEKYRPTRFWESSHAAVTAEKVRAGIGMRHVGGGESDAEAAALYRLRGANASRVLRKCSLPANPRIMELGSGGGYWVEFFRQLDPEIFVGSDLSMTAVERLSSRYPDYKFVCMLETEQAWSRIQSLGPYDLSLAIDVLYHITDDKTWEDALNHLCANVAASGLLLIADYFYEQPAERQSQTHVKHRKLQDYLDVLDKHGFEVEQVQPVFYFLNRIISGPWRDHAKLYSPILRLLTSNFVGLRLIGMVDGVVTAFARPMNPKCKTRFLLARREARV